MVRRLLLYQQHPSLEAVLDAPDFNTELRNRNPYLLDFLISDDSLSQLVTILSTSTTRPSHRRFIQLFTGSVSEVFTPFARNLRFARNAFSKLNDPNASFGVGTLSRMFYRAADERRAQDIVEVLRVDNPSIYHEIVKHFATGVVHQIARDLVTDSRPELIILAWYIFRALSRQNYEIPRSRWPRAVFLAPEIDLSDIVLTPTYQMRATEWLSAYFPMTTRAIPPVADFWALVAEWIISLDWRVFTPALFDLAKQLGPNGELKTRIVGWIREEKEIGEQLAPAVDYLAICTKLLKWWEAAGIVGKLLLVGKLRQTAAFGCIEIVRGCATNELFVQAIEQVVTAAWNRKVSQGGDFLLAGILVSIVALLPSKQQGESLFPSEFLDAWVRAQDRPPTYGDYIDIWSQPIKNIANDEFLAKLVEINEIDDAVPLVQDSD